MWRLNKQNRERKLLVLAPARGKAYRNCTTPSEVDGLTATKQARRCLASLSTMNVPFKVRAQAKAKGEKIKASKKNHDGKKKPRKAAAAAGKAKGDGGAAVQQPGTDKIVHEEEPAGEDDHAFFDDEDNADYAKFMLSLDPSGLTTFSKRAKDGVAVPPTSKKKSRQRKSEPTPAAAAETASNASATAVVDDATPAEGATKTPPTSSKPGTKEAVVDTKRRKASTTGWAVDDSGPERLPIKTRRGLLKPNERMKQQQQQQQQSEASTQDKHSTEARKAVAADNSKEGGDENNNAAAAGRAEETTSNGKQDIAGSGDAMSDGDDSVYDSADNSELEDYPMDEFNDGSSAGEANGATVVNGSKVDLAVLRQRRFEQKKALMGELCESILGAPEESLVRPKTVVKGEDERSRMEQLFALVSLGHCSTIALNELCLVQVEQRVSSVEDVKHGDFLVQAEGASMHA